MSKKRDKRQAAKRSRRKRKQQTSSQPSAQPESMAFPDRRAMERAMADIGRLLEEQEFDSIDEANAFLAEMMASGGIPSAAPRTRSEEAQDLMYNAWESSSPRERVRLARQALEISPDCADAYVLLAEEAARDLQKACELYQQGVEAGERALGEELFEEGEGFFWGILETRPYMRARAGLAQTLWALGEQEAAIAHYRELLRLNPDDNQGNRYELMACLVDLGRDDEAEELFAQYKDDAAPDWLYSRTLVAFRHRGNRRQAQRLLKKALEFNPHVPDYLLGRKKLPRSLPPYITLGGEDEAAVYAVRFFQAWSSTPGALDWLAEQVR
jgi:tetratricopeptide (TPR) repeat protein